MTTAERLAQAVLDGRADLSAALADAVLETNSGFAFNIAEKSRAAERERVIDRLLNEASHAIHQFGDLGEAQAAALEYVAQGLMYPAMTNCPAGRLTPPVAPRPPAPRPTRGHR